MTKKISWKWSTFKSNVKKQPLLIIAAVLLVVVASINIVLAEISEREFEELVRIYEETYLNHSHPHDPVSQPNLDPQVSTKTD